MAITRCAALSLGRAGYPSSSPMRGGGEYLIQLIWGGGSRLTGSTTPPPVWTDRRQWNSTFLILPQCRGSKKYKKVLRECKRHTAHHIASTHCAALSQGGGVPPSSQQEGVPPPHWPGWGLPPTVRLSGVPPPPSGLMGVPPPRCEQTDACENSTFPIPSGGNDSCKWSEHAHFYLQ